MNKNYSCVYDEETGHYIVKGATILFPNFAGEEQDYNPAGKRNFRLVLDEGLANELKGRGVHVRERPARDETEEPTYLAKIGVYSDADIRILSGKAMQTYTIDNRDPDEDDGPAIDRWFRKGHVYNGDISLEFHLSKNTKITSSSPYLRVDCMIIPIRKSRLMDEYQDYEMED